MAPVCGEQLLAREAAHGREVEVEGLARVVGEGGELGQRHRVEVLVQQEVDEGVIDERVGGRGRGARGGHRRKVADHTGYTQPVLPGRRSPCLPRLLQVPRRQDSQKRSGPGIVTGCPHLRSARVPRLLLSLALSACCRPRWAGTPSAASTAGEPGAGALPGGGGAQAGWPLGGGAHRGGRSAGARAHAGGGAPHARGRAARAQPAR
jgi:hypothetical protein